MGVEDLMIRDAVEADATAMGARALYESEGWVADGGVSTEEQHLGAMSLAGPAMMPSTGTQIVGAELGSEIWAPVLALFLRTFGSVAPRSSTLRNLTCVRGQ